MAASGISSASLAPSGPRRRAFVVLPLAWTAFVLVSTLTPARAMPHTPHWELLSFDTAAHAFVFWVLAVLAIFSARRQQWWPTLQRHAFSIIFGFTVGLGALIELLQMRMALGRNGEWSDVFSDALGAVAGLLLMHRTQRYWQ